MRTRGRLRMFAVVGVVAMAAGCTGGAGGGDKAGGGGEPVVLRMANASGTGTELGATLAIEYFVTRVRGLSGGDIRIDVVDQWGNFSPDAEQQVVRAVSTGAVDLGWSGTRVFDTLGIKSFQALTAPMLIDSYPLEDAVIRSGITGEMLKSLSKLGVTGLAVLADGLRKPIAVKGPLLSPADWNGITFQAFRSQGQATNHLLATLCHRLKEERRPVRQLSLSEEAGEVSALKSGEERPGPKALTRLPQDGCPLESRW